MIIGEPKVSKDVYMKYCRMRLVAMPMRSPMAVQTPKRFHSTKLLSLFTRLN